MIYNDKMSVFQKVKDFLEHTFYTLVFFLIIFSFSIIIGYAKAFDVGCVALAVVLSLIFFNFKVVGTREGTLITACSTGFAVKFLTKQMKKPLERFFNKQ